MARLRPPRPRGATLRAAPLVLAALALLALGLAVLVGVARRSGGDKNTPPLTPGQNLTLGDQGQPHPLGFMDLLYGLLLEAREGRRVDGARGRTMAALLSRGKALEALRASLERRMELALTPAQGDFLRRKSPFLAYRMLGLDALRGAAEKMKTLAGPMDEKTVEAMSAPLPGAVEGLSTITPFCNGLDGLQKSPLRVRRPQALILYPILAAYLRNREALEKDVTAPLAEALTAEEAAFVRTNLGRIRSMAEKERAEAGALVDKVEKALGIDGRRAP